MPTTALVQGIVAGDLPRSGERQWHGAEVWGVGGGGTVVLNCNKDSNTESLVCQGKSTTISCG